MSTQRNRKWVLGLSFPAFMAFLGIAIPTWVGTVNHIAASILFAVSGAFLLVSIYFGYLLWKHRRDEDVATTAEVRPSKIGDEAEHDKLMESLNQARAGAESLLKLKADTPIPDSWAPGWKEIIEIAKLYRDAIKRLRSARAIYYAGQKTKINLLISSFQRGRALFRRYKGRNDLSALKPELDTNSGEIIRQIDGVLEFLLQPTPSTNCLLPQMGKHTFQTIGIDAEESLIDAPGARIKNQDIGIKSRKSIINVPGSEIKDERKGKEDG